MAITTSAGQNSAMAVNKARLASSRSGPFSCTNAAPASAASSVGATRRRSSPAPSDRPIRCITGQWAATASRSRASAPGAGSHAATSIPRARKALHQLAPITPVPIMATSHVTPGAPAGPASPAPHRGLARLHVQLPDDTHRARHQLLVGRELTAGIIIIVLEPNAHVPAQQHRLRPSREAAPGRSR